jgi:hypothetical protein
MEFLKVNIKVVLTVMNGRSLATPNVVASAPAILKPVMSAQGWVIRWWMCFLVHIIHLGNYQFPFGEIASNTNR